MISRTNRFHGQKGLRYVYKNGKTERGPWFAIKYVLNPKRTSYRAAIVVGKKTHKSAVGRNKIRRRLYAAVRRLSIDITQPYDLVITVFSDELLEMSPVKLEQTLKSQLKNAGILTKRI